MADEVDEIYESLGEKSPEQEQEDNKKWYIIGGLILLIILWWMGILQSIIDFFMGNLIITAAVIIIAIFIYKKKEEDQRIDHDENIKAIALNHYQTTGGDWLEIGGNNVQIEPYGDYVFYHFVKEHITVGYDPATNTIYSKLFKEVDEVKRNLESSDLQKSFIKDEYKERLIEDRMRALQ